MVNIFFLDQDLEKAAQNHYDIHISKGILEIGWIFYTTRNILKIQNDGFYNQRRFSNNGCVTWASASYENYFTTYRMAFHLNEEFKYRTSGVKGIKSDHKTFVLMKKTLNEDNELEVRSFFVGKQMTPPHQAMAVKHQRDPDDFVNAYRCYYFYSKRFSLPNIGWSKRDIPSWYNSEYFNLNNIKPADEFDLNSSIK